MSDAFFSFPLHAVDPVAAAPFLFADSIADEPRDLLSSSCACIRSNTHFIFCLVFTHSVCVC